MTFVFDQPAWPPGKEWPAGVLPPPCVTLELSALELSALIRHHDEFAADAETAEDHESEMFHKARSSYLRQKLDAVAPHLLTPDRKGTA